jgi:predicted MPP superfamily phosphohydrolase
VNGTRLHVYGLDDFELSPGYWPKFARAEKEWSGIPLEEPLIVLSHNPDVFPSLPNRVALTLAAHTHGGQVRLPLIGSPIVPSSFGQRFARGLIEERGRTLFVNTGLGTSILPVRLGVPPEISVLTLRARQGN